LFFAWERGSPHTHTHDFVVPFFFFSFVRVFLVFLKPIREVTTVRTWGGESNDKRHCIIYRLSYFLKHMPYYRTLNPPLRYNKLACMRVCVCSSKGLSSSNLSNRLARNLLYLSRTGADPTTDFDILSQLGGKKK
jgi:hypothetical protein